MKYLFQNIVKDTRFRNGNSSLLDLLINKKHESIEEITYDTPIGKSDHLLLKIRFNTETMYESNNIKRISIDYKNSNYDKISRLLLNIKLDYYFNDKNKIDEDYNYIFRYIYDVIQKYSKRFFTTGKMKKGAKKIWINADIKEKIKDRNKLFKDYLSDKTSVKYYLYKKVRN